MQGQTACTEGFNDRDGIWPQPLANRERHRRVSTRIKDDGRFCVIAHRYRRASAERRTSKTRFDAINDRADTFTCLLDRTLEGHALTRLVRQSDRIIVLKDHRKIAELEGGQGVSAESIVTVIAEDGLGDASADAAVREEVTT